MLPMQEGTVFQFDPEIPLPEDWDDDQELADFRAAIAREQRVELMWHVECWSWRHAVLPAVLQLSVAVIALTMRRKLLHSNRLGPWLKR